MQHGDLIHSLLYLCTSLSYTWWNQSGQRFISLTTSVLQRRCVVLCQGGLIIWSGSCQEWPHLHLRLREREAKQSHIVLPMTRASYQDGDNKKVLRRGPQKHRPMQCILVWLAVLSQLLEPLNGSKRGLCFLVQGSVSQAKQLKLSSEVSERWQEVMSLALNCVTGRILWSQFSKAEV